MNKTILKVPQGIKYVSDWVGYQYPTGHCIVDKGVTGCGYTEYCLRNEFNTVLCSPRKLLLENKAEQHGSDDNIIYLKNEVTCFEEIETKMNEVMRKHISNCLVSGKPVKILVTYDSTHYVVDYLKSAGLLDKFMFVADEFQSIFLDSYYKAEVENAFVETLQDCPNIIYLSATPMLDKYLERLNEFKNLKYYSLDWSGTGFTEILQIQRRQTRSLGSEINKIIDDYLTGKFPITIDDKNRIVQSKEAVIYVNSVTEIIRSIKGKNLSPDQVNILCADTETNRKKLRKIKHSIGKIPLENEPRKMFTFCTSTCYIGADFYSDCASTYIFADPNLKWLALDISLDLPQIAGRQRNRENPFKNNITIFYKLIRGENLEDKSSFDALQAERRNITNLMLADYSNLNAKAAWVKKIRDSIAVSVYSDDFLSISKDGNPVYNTFIELANERAWEVSQKDYQDTISVTRAIASIGSVTVDEYKNRDDKVIQEFLDNRFYKTNVFAERLKLFCEFMDEHRNNKYIEEVVRCKIPDIRFRNYYYYFGTERCRMVRFRDNDLKNIMISNIKSDLIVSEVCNRIKVGGKYSFKEAKEILRESYFKVGVNIRGDNTTKEVINKSPKATDLNEWFETKNCKVMVFGKREHGIEILGMKDNRATP